MILVTGATGTTGGEVAKQLVAQGVKPRLLVRDPKKAQGFEGKAELVQGDLADPGSLAKVMEGVEKLYLVSAGLDGPKLEANAIDAARKAGVRHVVKLSVIGADAPAISFARWHAEGEQRLRDSGMAWTFLRPGNFMGNALNWAPSIKAQGAFFAPTGEGRYPMIDPADIGAVAVKALTTPGHEGRAYALSGPESMSDAQYAAVLSRVLGREVRFVDVPPQAARDAMSKLGMPAGYVDALLELYAVMRAGYADGVLPAVEEVTGRKPATFEDWARRNAAAFR